MILRPLGFASLVGALACALALVASGADAAPASGAAPAANTARAAGTPPAANGTHSSAGARKPTATRHHAVSSAKPKTDGAPRRLTDVHIEGEMPVPQVLFITARDQRRYVDFQHQRYLRDSRALGAASAAPTRVSAAGDGTRH